MLVGRFGHLQLQPISEIFIGAFGLFCRHEPERYQQKSNHSNLHKYRLQHCFADVRYMMQRSNFAWILPNFSVQRKHFRRKTVHATKLRSKLLCCNNGMRVNPPHRHRLHFRLKTFYNGVFSLKNYSQSSSDLHNSTKNTRPRLSSDQVLRSHVTGGMRSDRHWCKQGLRQPYFEVE